MFILLMLPVSALAGGEEALDARLASLSAHADPVLHYRETRDGGLFSGPVEYTGRLEWRAETGELIQWVDAPATARLAVDGDTVEVRTGNGKTRRLPLSSRPGLAAMMKGLRALLAGDGPALRAVFVADYLAGADGEWLLHLKPRDPALAAQLSLMEVRGRADRVTAIDRVEPDGSRQSMTILATPPPPSP